MKVGASGCEEFGIGVLLIVDDTTLLADTVDGLRRGLELIHDQFRRYGLSVNVTKSFAVCFAGIDSLRCVACGRNDGARAATIICDGCDRAWHVNGERSITSRMSAALSCEAEGA